MMATEVSSVAFAILVLDIPCNLYRAMLTDPTQPLNATFDSLAELARTNAQLRAELAERREAEAQLRVNEQALRLSQERLDSILSSIADVVWSADPQTQQLFYLNSAVETVYGRSMSEFLGCLTLWQDAVYPDDRDRYKQATQILYTSGSRDVEYRIVHPDGNVRWICDRARLVRDNEGMPVRVDGIITDITERRRAQAQLQYETLHDGLTGLPNRNLLIDRIEQAIKRNQRQNTNPFAVMFLDLDRFKVVNDSLGHLDGDQLLILVAQRLEQCARAGDTVARLGGDEFVILLEDVVDANAAVKVADRIHQSLEPAIILDHQEVFVTASIGIAIGDARIYQQPADLLRDADTAMYRAKSRGQGGHEIFAPAMHTTALKRLQLQNQLRRAIEREEFLVYYQPIVSLTDHQIQGFEALVRWQHPEWGLVSPIEFIPIAEETGLIVAIDRWVLRTACQQLQCWRQQYPGQTALIMSVNLSGKHFSQPGLIEFLDQVLLSTGLDGSSLKLEITESVIIQNTESVIALIDQLQARKVQVCLDDFGTGYSSLSYLHSFPFDTLKIDRSFVKRLGIEGQDWEIVKAIVNLGLTLSMNVIAEGVETGEQLAHLKTLNCDSAQGYWFSQPVTSEDITSLLRKQIQQESATLE
jgi:diguanylate cyclase (GGDEF)-like protein/PAS domain S-box-containing protein